LCVSTKLTVIGGNSEYLSYLQVIDTHHMVHRSTCIWRF